MSQDTNVPYRWTVREGTAVPLGVTWVESERQYNLSLYAPYARRVQIEFYTEDNVNTPVLAVLLDPTMHKSWTAWHYRIDENEVDDKKITFYGYRVDNGDTPGSDWNKILLDPLARAVHFPPSHDRGAACQPGLNNAGKAPLGFLEPIRDDALDMAAVPRPRHDQDLVIYELHVKGFTKNDPSVPEAHRGTYLGVIDKIPYLKDLGVTAIELLPVYEVDVAEPQYWGYSPLNFFSPTSRYASQQGCAVCEFRQMVKALHENGIEVILDVVYNHTTEGNFKGPNYSFRGIANNAYYLMADNERDYWDASGTGNTLCSAEPIVRRLILESMRYWVLRMGVDGFRFDLATALTRTDGGGFDSNSTLIHEINADPVFSNVRLIAEAWDAAGGYQLGEDWPGLRWMQWNGKYRDTLRAFVKSDMGKVSELMTRIHGSTDLFPDSFAQSRRAYQSINFVTCHDGFCLYDLVSYNEKHNQANGEDNGDGTNNNISWNCGFEGDPAPLDVLALRKKQIRNFFTLLMLSNGTPMFVAGDEFLQTQNGNNNPYNQDNETSWLDWSKFDTNKNEYRFFKNVIAFRKQHPSLAPGRFWNSRVSWYGTDGNPDLNNDSHSLAFHLSGAEYDDDDLYVLINAYWEPLTFKLQKGQPGDWQRVIDTAAPPPDDFREKDTRVGLDGLEYKVEARSIVVLLRPKR